jgi:hypothetical protein
LTVGAERLGLNQETAGFAFREQTHLPDCAPEQRLAKLKSMANNKKEWLGKG